MVHRESPLQLPILLSATNNIRVGVHGLGSAFFALALLLSLPALAGPWNEKVADSIPAPEKKRLETLRALSPTELDAIAAAVSPEKLQSRTTEILSAQDRQTYLRSALERQPGVQLLGELKGEVVTPIAAKNSTLTVGGSFIRVAPHLSGRPRGGHITIGGISIPISPLWPNGPMPSLTPAAGITGPLVDARDAEWSDLDGLPLPGSIALMNFRGGRNFERLYSLGAQAVIVIEDDGVTRDAAEGLFMNTPVPVPRFYVDRETGEKLRAQVNQPATVNGGNRYMPRPYESLFAWLPPQEPLRIKIDKPTPLADLADSYGIRPGELKRANNLQSDDLQPGQEITIPNLPDPLVVAVPIDSVSVVPTEPHGAFVAGNIAAALEMLEHLATSDSIRRRKGILFAFLDAENMGGLSSRKLAEYILIEQGKLQAAQIKNTNLDRYREAVGWFDGNKLNAETARWLGEEWLLNRVETARIAAAEARVQAQTVARETDDAKNKAEFDRLERLITDIRELRDATLGNNALPWPERLDAFRTALEQRQEPLPFTLPEMRDRLRAELTDEESLAANDAGNRQTAAAILDKLGSGTQPRLGYYLDLSDGSTTIGIGGKTLAGDFRGGLPAAGDYLKNLSERFRKVTAFAATRAGWPQDFTFVSESDAADFAIFPTEAVPYYPEFWKAAGVALLPLGSVNDPLTRLDTPHDTLDRVDFTRLATQARTALLLIATGLESPLDSLAPSSLAASEYGQLRGATVQFNIRSGIDAKDPVPGTYVYYPAVAEKLSPDRQNTLAARGSRRGILEISRLNGSYTLPLEEIEFSKKVGKVFAHRLDPESALFDKSADAGQVGTQRQTSDFNLLAGQSTEKNIVLSELAPLVFFAGTDPMDYETIGAKGQRINVVDVQRDGQPEHFAVVNPVIDYSEASVASTILLMPPGRRARIAIESAGSRRLLLPGTASQTRPKGEGHVVGETATTLPLTPLAIAREWHALADARQQLYARYGLRDQSLADALESSGKLVAEAEAAFEQKHWQAGIGASRQAWGILEKTYPRVLRLGREAVFSVVILMALLVPGCVFLEKLAIGSRSIIAQLIGSAALFCAGVVFLRFFHPAFQISVSPFIVMIAFTMILMSIIVLTISYQRFEVLLRRARAAGGEVEGESVSLGDSLTTALSLGVSNLKKRPSRTILTVLTVSALTFSIVAFVSVSGRETISARTVPLERDIEGEMVEPIPPKYDGALFREFYWVGVSDNTISALRTEFGSAHDVVTRGWYIQVEGGNNAEREGANQVKIDLEKKSAIVTGVMTFEPGETEFSGLNAAVTGQRWFTADADRFQIILPDNIAAELGITAEMIAAGPPTVRMMNHDWRVVGILDVAQADRMRDVNGKSLAMVDYLRSAISGNVAGELASEPESNHMSWRRLVIVPTAAAADVNAKTRSVAIRFATKEGADSFYAGVVQRLNRTFFGAYDGGLALISTRSKVSFGGLAKLVVPVLLCVLIVANTMLGAVDERKGEVGMLGAIGLSPAQISFLLLSESAVFSVLGIVFGVFAGLFFANAVPWIAAHTGGFLGTLSFNFTSILSMLLAMGAGVVVLLATLLPARKAAALAAPSGMARWRLPAPTPDGRIEFELPFTLTRGNAVGMLAFFRRFMLNHTDATSADFNCRNLALGIVRGDEQALRLTADMWLSPYDLDVAQQFALKMLPTSHGGACAVVIDLRRTSGAEEAWLRTNYAFLDLVRRQFLLWRNLDPETRAHYIDEGAVLLRETS